MEVKTERKIIEMQLQVSKTFKTYFIDLAQVVLLPYYTQTSVQLN